MSLIQLTEKVGFAPVENSLGNINNQICIIVQLEVAKSVVNLKVILVTDGIGPFGL